MKRNHIIFGLFIGLLSVAFLLLHSTATYAATCGTGPALAFNRNQYCGYFSNINNNNGSGCGAGYVICGGFPNSVTDAASFISFIHSELYNNGVPTQSRTGAEFIVLTMLNVRPSSGGTLSRTVTTSQYNDWVQRVNSYASNNNYQEIGTGSYVRQLGPNGSVFWDSNVDLTCDDPEGNSNDKTLHPDYYIDSYYQAPQNDDAFYDLNTTSSPTCNDGTQIFIEFFNTAGQPVYKLRRICGNPIGDTGGLHTAPSPYNLIPSVNATVSSGKAAAVPGDTVTFTFAVANTEDGDSDNTTCTEYDNLYAGDHAKPGGPTYDRGSNKVTDCSNKVFGGGSSTTLKTETIVVPVADINHTICRTLYVQPEATDETGSRGAEDCVYVSTYDLVPTINVVSNSSINRVAEVGDQITFTYSVANTTSGWSRPADCTEYRLADGGYHAAPPSPAVNVDTTGTISTASSTVCTNQSFAPSPATTSLGTETVTITAGMEDTTLCRSLIIAPSSPTQAKLGAEACVPIVDMPYTRVFGGDVSAGNAQPSQTCNANADYDAGIAGWNTDGGLYNGAGTQLAAFAIGDITHFVSAQASPGGSSGPAPSGLAFSNSGAPTGTVYGGNLGAGSLPCMNDYYVIPAGAQQLTGPTVNLNNLVSLTTNGAGAFYYDGGGTLTLTGTLPSMADSAETGHIQIFVQGANVYIPSSITYQNNAPAAWGKVSDIPMLELVVEGDASTGGGNIYVGDGATELDGTYIAQNAGGNGGQIATCATDTGPVPTGQSGQADSTLEANCDNQLRVYGAFVADNVVLERSLDTLSNSNSDSAANLTSSAAEQFDYGPAAWLAQPQVTPGALTYDTIVDLPPVL